MKTTTTRFRPDGHILGSACAALRRAAFTFVLSLVMCASAWAQINIEVGDLEVNFTYLGFGPSWTGAEHSGICTSLFSTSGQRISGGCLSSNRDVVSLRQLTPGDYNVILGFDFDPLSPLIPVTISPAQTTSVNFELSDLYGLVTGTLLVNGEPGGFVSLVSDGDGRTVGVVSTPPDGVFTAMLRAGNGTGTAFPGNIPVPSFTVINGQTANLGGVLGNTQLGTDVLVQPTAVDENGDPLGTSPINFVFEEVTLPGQTSVTITEGGPAPSEGFKLGKPATYFVLETDAEFAGSVEVCIDYSTIQFGNESKLQLQHFTDTDGDGVDDDWVNITATLDVENDFICGTTESFSFFAIVEPSNQSPVLSSNDDEVIVTEGALALNTGTFSDPDADPVLLSASLGTIMQTGPDTWSWSYQTTDGPAQAQVVITADDGNGLMAMIPFELEVNNVPPSGALVGPTQLNEGEAYQLALAGVSDPSVADVSAGLEFSFNCGDGSGFTIFNLFNSVQCPATDDNGDRIVNGQVKDKDGGVTSQQGTIEILNVAPAITAISGPTDPLPLSATATIVVDYEDPGLGDTHHCTFSWDDDPTHPTETAVAGNGAGTGQCTGTFDYLDAGVYTVTATVTDDDGGFDTRVFEFVVVYDPSAGFVTGGGQIQSAPGSYRPDPALEGIAHFGFVSKYKKGADTPTGQTQFQFQVAGFNFHSTSYEWLVVAGNKAQYKGDGTVNGQFGSDGVSGYGFLLTATDGDAKNGGDGIDKFRIKVWDKSDSEVVYDNKHGISDDINNADPQAILHGSIVVHTKGNK